MSPTSAIIKKMAINAKRLGKTWISKMDFSIVWRPLNRNREKANAAVVVMDRLKIVEMDAILIEFHHHFQKGNINFPSGG